MVDLSKSLEKNEKNEINLSMNKQSTTMVLAKMSALEEFLEYLPYKVFIAIFMQRKKTLK